MNIQYFIVFTARSPGLVWYQKKKRDFHIHKVSALYMENKLFFFATHTGFTECVRFSVQQCLLHLSFNVLNKSTFNQNFFLKDDLFLMPQLQGSRFEPELGLLSVWSCSCSPCVRVSFLPLSSPLQIDYTKLPVVDNVCVCVRGAVQWTDIPSSLNSPTLCAVFTGRGSRVVTQHE